MSILLIILFLQSEGYALDLARAEQYEKALPLLEKIKNPSVENQAWQVVCHHQLSNKDRAISMAEAVLYQHETELSRRHYALLSLIKDDAERWKEGDLHHVKRKMANVGRRIVIGQIGKETQEEQAEIVKMLTDMIDKLENPPPSPQGADAQQQPGQQKPLEDSVPIGDTGKGIVNEKKLRNLAENWGKMPESERAKAMQEMTADLPPQYREVIERYLKSLSRVDK